MKRIFCVCFVISLFFCSCNEKEEANKVIDVQGTWYGYLDEHYVSKPEKYIALTLKQGKASISRLFHSYTSGWYDSDGTYKIGGDGVLLFDIEMTPSELFKDHPDIPKITITHAETDYSEPSGELLKVYYTKKYRDDYFDEELRGTTSYHWLWFDRNRPSN